MVPSESRKGKKKKKKSETFYSKHLLKLPLTHSEEPSIFPTNLEDSFNAGTIVAIAALATVDPFMMAGGHTVLEEDTLLAT